jgi:hypothetical protein
MDRARESAPCYTHDVAGWTSLSEESRPKNRRLPGCPGPRPVRTVGLPNRARAWHHTILRSGRCDSTRLASQDRRSCGATGGLRKCVDARATFGVARHPIDDKADGKRGRAASSCCRAIPTILRTMRTRQQSPLRRIVCRRPWKAVARSSFGALVLTPDARRRRVVRLCRRSLRRRTSAGGRRPT